MINLARLLKHPATISLGLIAGAFGLTCALWQSSALQPAELFIYDQFIRWRSPKGEFDPRLTIIGIDDEDIRHYDYSLTDNCLAQLIEELCRNQPAVIGIDLFRDLPVPRSGEQSEKLRTTLLGHDNVVCAFRLGDERSGVSIPPPPVLQAIPERCAFTDFPYDHKTIRRALLYAGGAGDVRTSLGMQVALGYLALHEIQPEPAEGDLLRLGKTTFPQFRQSDGGYVRGDDRGYQIFIDFLGPQSFRTLSLTDMLTGQYEPADISGRIVLIGITAQGVKDFLSTPLHDQHLGVELQAQVINQLLRAALDGSPPLRVWPNQWKCVWLLGWCGVAGLSGFFIRSPWNLAFALFSSVGLIVSVSWFLFQRNYWIPVALPVMGTLSATGLITSYMSFFENRERRLVTHLFRRNVSIADTIMKRRDEFFDGGRLRPEELTATILFTDLRGYSTLSETMGPGQLLEWLNEYQDAMASEVNKHSGIVISFGGDALMAAFGVPVARHSEEEIRRDAINAVDCALAMKTVLETLNAGWRDAGRNSVSMRVGIHTGLVVAGCLGSADRLEFTTIGDTTNTAARLESLDREVTGPADSDICRILIGNTTFDRVGECFDFEDLGEKKLKGKAQPVRVYRILARKTSAL